MTPEEAYNYLQGIAITAVELQPYVTKLDQEEMGTLRQIDTDLNDLLDFFEEGAGDPAPAVALVETYK